MILLFSAYELILIHARIAEKAVKIKLVAIDSMHSTTDTTRCVVSTP